MVGSAPATPTATALLAAHRRRHHDGSALGRVGETADLAGGAIFLGSNAAFGDHETSRLHPPNFVKTSGDGARLRHRSLVQSAPVRAYLCSPRGDRVGDEAPVDRFVTERVRIACGHLLGDDVDVVRRGDQDRHDRQDGC
jgi:hypothetical protein